MRRAALFSALFATFCYVAVAQRGHGRGGGGAGGGTGGGQPGGIGSGVGGHQYGGAPGGGYGAWRGGGRHGGTTSGYGGGTHSPAPGIYSFPNTYTPNVYGSVSGFGNVVFPGTGHAPGAYSPFSIVDPTFGARLSNTVSGFGYGSYGGYRRFGYNTGPVLVPYVVPYYVPYYDPQPPPPPVIYQTPPQIIYVVPGEAERSVTTSAPEPQRNGVVTYVVPSRNSASEAASAPSKRLYLIALKNHSIYSASEYWVEDGTLHYVTSYGAHNLASLDQVDLDFTIQLNRERGIDFRLEKEK